MRLLSLSIHNIGLYAGWHHFDLTTQPAQDSQRNIILFRGHNGAGKSTLFFAVGLALHGLQSIGDRVGQQQYNDFILNKLHRRTVDGDTIIEQSGQIGIRFEYIQSGRPSSIWVERHWQRNGGVVEETLKVTKDDVPLELPPSDYQYWLNDLLAPGLSPLCFFDAERLDTLSSPEHHKNSLGDTLRRLLGLDLVDRLLSDLNLYTSRMGDVADLERLRLDNAKYEEELFELDVKWTQIEQEEAEWKERADNTRAELRNAEHHLATEGGSYAARRPFLQDRLVEVKREREALEGHLREIAGQLLPFTLAPNLCQRLSRHLKEESHQYRRHMVAEFWQQSVTEISQGIEDEQTWYDLAISQSDRQEITDRILRLIQHTSTFGDGSIPIIHHLAEVDQERLQEWIAQARYTVPQQIKSLGERLAELQTEQRRLEDDLQRVPADEAIAHSIAEIERLQTLLSEAEKQLSSIAERRGSLRFQRDEKTRLLQHIASQLEAAALVERQTALATRSKLVLRTYQDELIRQRLAALEEKLIANFNTICRKKKLLLATSIDPKDLSIQLQTADGKTLSLSDFSAGERQLYSLALLQAFRQVSGQQLPLLIDTPLARLDSSHRRSLLSNYFPAVSDQVLLFATETEIDENLLQQIRPFVVREYNLSYDPQYQQTQIHTDALLLARSA